MLKLIGFSAVPVTFTLNINFLGSYEICYLDAILVSDTGFDIININGHGSKIYSSGKDNDEYTWIQNSENKVVIASDLIIEGFNTAVVNKGGACYFNNVQFNKNKVNYFIKTDNGGAILNEGLVVCNNCSFTENYAKNGGAIFNQGSLILDNCTFENNEAYGQGDNVAFVEGSQVKINGENITGNTDIAQLYKDSHTAMLVISIIAVFVVSIAVICYGGFFVATLLIANLAFDPILALSVGVAAVAVPYLGLFGITAYIYTSSDDDNQEVTEIVI